MKKDKNQQKISAMGDSKRKQSGSPRKTSQLPTTTQLPTTSQIPATSQFPTFDKARTNKAPSPLPVVQIIEEDDDIEASSDSVKSDINNFKKCGLFIYPEAIQFLANPKAAVLAFGFAAFLQGGMCNGMINVVLQAIEREFQISSTKSGTISSSFNLGSCIFLMPVTFYASSQHRPRLMSVGCVLMGFGALIFASPHYLTPPYKIVFSDDEDLCRDAPTNATTSLDDTDDYVQGFFQIWHLFLVAQFLNGAATTPFYTTIVAYFDDNLKHHTATQYIGLYYFFSILGPVAGYLIAGLNMKSFTNKDVSLDELKITYTSSVWVGLWWEQFVYVGILAFIAAIPVSCVPGELPKEPENKGKTTRILCKEDDKQLGSFAEEIKELVSNPFFMSTSVGVAMETMIASGLSVIGAKCLTVLFYLNTSQAGMLLGAIGICGAGLGILFGGYAVGQFKLSTYGTAKLCSVAAFISWFFLFGFLIHCDNIQLIGVNDNLIIDNRVPCSATCHCNSGTFYPVCSWDEKVYTSACAAGCRVRPINQTGYLDCSCVKTKPPLGTPEATNQICENANANCHKLWIFCLVVFACLFIAFAMSAPSVSISLRVVQPKQKNICMGFQWMCIRMIGTIPAGALFGFMVDLGCTSWQQTSGKRNSACAIYDNGSVARNITILLLIIKSLSIASYSFTAFMLSKCDRRTVLQPEVHSQTNS